MTFEVMQMGQLSVLYEILAKSPTHKKIAAYFGVTETVLISWLYNNSARPGYNVIISLELKLIVPH